MFAPAKKEEVPLKLAISGASGSGKTYSALRLARGLVGPTGRVAVVDTENKSASLYADRFKFDVCNVAPREYQYNGGRQTMKSFNAADFANAVNAAISAKYDVLIIDSASHAWEATLDAKTRLDAGGGNSFTNWGAAGNLWKNVVNTILQASIPVIACFRSKTEYVLETSESGKIVPRKFGLAPIARDGSDYEFTTWFDVDRNHIATASKDRTEIFDAPILIDEHIGEVFANWLKSENAEATPKAPKPGDAAEAKKVA